MGILDSIHRLFRREADTTEDRRLPSSSPRVSGSQFLQPYYGSEMAVAAVFRCVGLLSDSVSGLRMRYMKRSGGIFVEDTSSSFHYLLTVQPQPEMSVYTFWNMAVRYMLMNGNAYIYPRKVGGEVTDLVLCRPEYVSHDTVNDKYTIHDPYNGVDGTFGESDIIHLFLHSTDGKRGESVIGYARQTAETAMAGNEETRNRFTNGGTVRGMVTNDRSVTGFGEYQDSQLACAATDIDGRFKRGENIVSLPGQVDFKQISLSSADMQFLESRKFTVREICRFFGVHPSFVFDDTSNNYKSAEMSNVAFLSMTLDPILKRIENEFTRKLISPSMCCRRIFQFDRRGIYSLDLDARASYQMKTIQCGLYSVNDWRRMENQPDIEGGDTVFVSTNLARIDSLARPDREQEMTEKNNTSE